MWEIRGVGGKDAEASCWWRGKRDRMALDRLTYGEIARDNLWVIGFNLSHSTANIVAKKAPRARHS